ncbi:MAG: tRNA uridine-5-carboxymethylaminomethyl(34) synthesis GTPase MnmE [Candidatus Krumholzibacteria bacterium]|nr:tRNA uridine-5-carboxymethylaminomethyl(34) synthesis GTPase MnmE [Candidatus Krumholzibacteria bacterium]
MLGELHDTITALSTPAGESGIAVIRITGVEALDILSSIFSCNDRRRSREEWQHQRLYHGFVVDGSETIDEVMCAVMRGPDSYTGQDTVEISCHGNTLLITRILNLIFSRGARCAEGGEFTKRAFLNGKIDLIQAEAVADLIHARSELQRKVAHEQLAGVLSRKINRLADELLEMLGTIEANIDFIEEGIDTLDVQASIIILDRHLRTLEELLKDSSFSKPFREGYRVAIVGPVNAGKSSIFNRLLGENRSIVTEVPGTTRDVLREPIVLEGLLFVLQDTAGLRGTKDRIESIGVDLAESALSGADLVLFVVDASAPWTSELSTRLESLHGQQTVVALNKMDLPIRITPDQVESRFPGLSVVAVSVRTGEGLEELKKTLIEFVGGERLNWIARERIVLNSRLISILAKTRERIGALRRSFEQGAPLEILALDAREALQHYELATGKRYTADLLDNIFSRFCIGK